MNKLQLLRKHLQNVGISACIIPSTDPHQSEYIANHWKLREWFSGFSGSAGTLVVTLKEAYLWTDSRYFNQAEQQLKDSGIALKKLGKSREPEHLFWLRDHLQNPLSMVGFDARMFSVTQLREMEEIFEESHVVLGNMGALAELVWENRPAMPTSPIFRHELQYCGQSTADKLKALRGFLKEQKADYQLISSLDDIAWLFNIRGSDVAFNPVVYAFAVVSLEKATLFIDSRKVNVDIAEQFLKEGIEVKEYDLVYESLENLPPHQKIVFDPQKTNVKLRQAIPEHCRIYEAFNHTTYLKALKNQTEIENWRKVMIKDGVALLRFYRWLEMQLKERKTVTEWTAAERLHEFRSEQTEFIGDSFGAISAYCASGASPHYSPIPNSSKILETNGLYLLDSGGQYLGGTTDITRTVCLGTPTADEKRDFTLVLKGFIALSKVVFPVGTKGYQLEALAKTALWQYGLNYLHGTGHGVGFCLNVHEGPQAFGSGITADPNSAFEVGMVTTIEPAYYRQGKYGIRTENMVLCVESEFEGFLTFEALTLFPIDTEMIDFRLLEAAEKKWLKDYHQKVWAELSPALDAVEQNWLHRTIYASSL